MNPFNVTVDIPEGTVLTSNQRLHWAPLAQRKREIRFMACVACRGCPTITERVRITVTAHYGHSRGVRDAQNLDLTAKCLVDGIVDSETLTDDNTKYVESVTCLKGDPIRDLPAGVVRFVIRFEATT